MRLCKPGFSFNLPIPCDDLVPTAAAGASSCSSSGGGTRPAGLGGELMLPLSFGDIYLGETFSCYISLSNTSRSDLAHAGLKVEVQTQLQRETLDDTTANGASINRFAPKQTLDRVVRYELKDIGVHILICSASYVDGAGERKTSRKFFKFQVRHVNKLHAAPPQALTARSSDEQVQNPLSMKSKTHTLAAQNEILIVTQLQASSHDATYETQLLIHYIIHDACF